MKEKALLGNPFIWEPRGCRPAKYGGGRAAHVTIAPILCPKGVVVELKRKILEGIGRKEGEGGRSTTNLWPTGHAWPSFNP
jgi:hypothetical protein